MSIRPLAIASLWVASLWCAAPLHAGTASIDSMQWHPSSTANGYLGLDGGLTAPHLGFSLSLTGDYAHKPLVLRDAAGNIPPNGNIIEHQLALDVQASFAIFERVELGVLLPVAAKQTVDNTLLRGQQLATSGVGDLHIDLKVRMHTFRLAGANRVVLAVVAGIRAPTGDSNSFLGQDGAVGYPRLVAEWHNQRGGVVLNFGAVVRSQRVYTDLYVTHQIAVGLGGRVRLHDGLSLVGQLASLVGVGLPGSESLKASEAPLEVDAGLEYRARFGLTALLAGGAGLTRGYGTPDGRFIFGIGYQSPPRRAHPPRVLSDRDHDGVPDAEDKCPDKAGPREREGCPEPDSDGDGVPDARDRCPDAAGPARTFGCPDVDSDGDGVVDRLDKCPLDPGPPQRDGCPAPPADKDGDGVPDAEDKCPDAAGPAATAGCPDIDSDGDGIVDMLDKCPFEPETYNGVADEDGCPDAGAELASLSGNRIVVKQPMAWKGVEPDSPKLVAVLARLITVYRDIRLVTIEVGAGPDGVDAQARAEALKAALIKAGVDAARLHASADKTRARAVRLTLTLKRATP